jgi:hypothetical protein
MIERFAKKIFYTSLIFLMLCGAFGYGVLVGVYKYWPYETAALASNMITMFLKSGEFSPEGRIITPAHDAPRVHFTVHDTKHVIDGYYALMGWDSEQGHYAIWLYDHRGVKLHSWSLAYAALDMGWSEYQSGAPHGMQALADGSIIFNYDGGNVMVRLGVCSEPIWISDGNYHHSIDSDENGDLWTWRGESDAYDNRQFLVRFDPATGEILQEIDFINEIVKKHDEESYIFSMRPDDELQGREHGSEENVDLFHPNDIEVLSSGQADKFDGYSAGDLLISLRNINLVTVIDPGSKRIKWWSTGPWIYQHDPDFTSDGKISVFSNNSDRLRSEILTIDPASKRVSNNLLHGNLNFYTRTMGEHSYLPNGNILIISPGEGRVIEVTSTGDKVLEFNNVINKEYNAIITNGQWLPPDFYKKLPRCSGEN